MLAQLRKRASAWAMWAAAAALGGAGPVPQHVAFIMDGNRRYAERQHLARVAGHSFGYERLIDALEWCLELGVRCVSVYAFSLDNYKRSGEEVATLMQLAEEKLAHMLQARTWEQAVLTRHGVQVRVIGNLSLAPVAVQRAAAAVMDATRHHTGAVLNICFSYTASQEMQQALDVAAAAQGAHPCSSIAAVEQQLYTVGCPPVDLLVRTSGERRLSDFMLWQSRHALLVFTRVLWPDFSLLDLVAAVLEYQRHAATLCALRAAAEGQQDAAQAAAERRACEQAGASSALHEQQQQQQAGGVAPGALKACLPSGAHRQAEDSPCSVASPASPSSPSSRSDGSEHLALQRAFEDPGCALGTMLLGVQASAAPRLPASSAG